MNEAMLPCGGGSPREAKIRFDRARSAGFTIVELTISAVILIMMTYAVTTLTISGSAAQKYAERVSRVTEIAQDIVDEIRRDLTSSVRLFHKDAIGAKRVWTFGYKAGSRTGLAEFYTVVNTVDGDGRAGGADEWALNSAKILAQQGTPVRLFVNADGVKSTGPGCDDGYANFSVLGAPSSPLVGNAQFTLEAHGLPPGMPYLLMLNLGGNVATVDLAPFGAPGCVLRTTLQAQLLGQTSGGDAVRGEGRVVVPAPIPSDGSLRGVVFSVQVGAIDTKPKRPFPMVVTNGIEVTIR